MACCGKNRPACRKPGGCKPSAKKTAKPAAKAKTAKKGCKKKPC